MCTNNNCESEKYYVLKVKLFLLFHSSAPHFKKYGVTTSQAFRKVDNNADTKFSTVYHANSQEWKGSI